ncbi:MAG: FRG domain-containing protein [Gemmatimonadota bacterium]
MPRYPILTIEGRRYFRLRYTDLPAGERHEPVASLVPFHDSLEDALAAVRQYSNDRLDPLRRQFSGTSADADASYRDKLANPTIFYRGQSNLDFSIVPTRFRLGGVSDPATEIARRIGIEEERAGAILRHFTASSGADLTELQSRAVARHFGAPSTLVDFTFDPSVAASFAQPQFSEQELREGPPLGLIYAIDMGQLQEMFGMMAWSIGADGGREIHLVNTKTRWGLPFLTYNDGAKRPEVQTLAVDVPPVLREQHARLRTCIVPGVSRIEAQGGLFLELSLEDATDAATPLRFWTLLDFLARKWCFRRSDAPYEVRDADGRLRDLFHETDAGLEGVAAGE